jgi:hypothetical protein
MSFGTVTSYLDIEWGPSLFLFMKIFNSFTHNNLCFNLNTEFEFFALLKVTLQHVIKVKLSL